MQLHVHQDVILVRGELGAGDHANGDAQMGDGGLAGLEAFGVGELDGDLRAVFVHGVGVIKPGGDGGEDGDQPDQGVGPVVFFDHRGGQALDGLALVVGGGPHGKKVSFLLPDELGIKTHGGQGRVSTTTAVKASRPMPGMTVAMRCSFTSETRTAITNTSVSMAQRPTVSMIL